MMERSRSTSRGHRCRMRRRTPAALWGSPSASMSRAGRSRARDSISGRATGAPTTSCGATARPGISPIPAMISTACAAKPRASTILRRPRGRRMDASADRGRGRAGAALCRRGRAACADRERSQTRRRGAWDGGTFRRHRCRRPLPQPVGPPALTRGRTGRDAPAQSSTSSASERSPGGTARPSIRAVDALMTSSYLFDWSTGSSAGFAPLRMRPTWAPTDDTHPAGSRRSSSARRRRQSRARDRPWGSCGTPPGSRAARAGRSRTGRAAARRGARAQAFEGRIDLEACWR